VSGFYQMEIINNENLSFEDALSQLEKIVTELESGRIKLDDAVTAYEKAVSLKKLCEEKLRSASLKIEKIEINQDDNVSTTNFDVPEE
jgi:exodeoxyribonuclease VII small subunit